MTTLLVPVTLAGMAFAFSRTAASHGTRESLLRAILAFGAIVVLLTEGLSLTGSITARNISISWAIAAIGAWGCALLMYKGRPVVRSHVSGSIPPLLAAACAMILGTTLLIAVVAPPDFVDAMTYHMGRVVHWIQARSVSYYPSGIERQNYQMPFAEYVILHLQLLSGGDRWANLVQWFAFALSGLVVSRILAEFRQPSWIQWSGALLVFTTPSAILQSTSAQNDLVVGLFLLAFALTLWRVLSGGSRWDSLFCGLALGLTLLSKGTAYLYTPAVALAMLGGLLVVGSLRRTPLPLAHLAIVGLIAASLNMGPWIRNQVSYGAPICCGETYFVERVTPGDMVSNVLRQMSIHLSLPKVRAVVQRGVEALSPVDVSDPATTYDGIPFKVYFSLNEALAGNFLLMVLWLWAGVVIAFDRSLRTGPAAVWMAVSVAAFLAFAQALKWQPMGGRLHTPVFLIAAVPIALVLGTRTRAFGRVLHSILFAGSLPYLLLNDNRPLLPLTDPSILFRDRTEQYFIDKPHLESDYRAAAAWLRSHGEPEIGVHFKEYDYEYPFWILIKSDPAGPPRIRHVGVYGKRAAVGRPALPPPRIVVSSTAGERQRIDGTDFVRVRDFGELVILRRVGHDDRSPQ